MPNYQVLGHLEIEVLEHLWQCEEGTAKSIHSVLSEQRELTLNTVQSTLERLFRKELLVRNKKSHSYVYQPAESKEVMLGQLIQDMLSRFDNDPQSSIAAVINAAELADESGLEKLEKQIQLRRDQGEL